MASKLYSLTGSTARVCKDGVPEVEVSERKSKIPKMPKKTFRVDGRGRSSKLRKSSSRCQNFSVSLIPRPEWKKCYKKSFTSDRSKTKLKGKNEKNQEREEDVMEEDEEDEKPTGRESGETQVMNKQSTSECCSLEAKINEDLANFKNHVLKIPEFWSDAGQTVTNVLKNAVNIVSKQYPSADLETFEQEIQNILRATEAMKNKILNKTESIINEANKIYSKDDDLDDKSSENESLTSKEDEVKGEAGAKKNMVSDASKANGEIKEMNELEKAIKNKKDMTKEGSKSAKRNLHDHDRKNDDRRLNRKKSKLRLDCLPDPRIKGFEKNMIQSCGDVIQQDKKMSSPQSLKSETGENMRPADQCQTSTKWANKMLKKEEILAGLNHQILELQQLCQDHISKFKNFNLQIKLRGICNKAQVTSASREIQILNEEKFKLAEKNSKLHFYNRDLETTIKQKEQDLLQKDRLITQQKKLLNVRDELIEMLKNKCKIEPEHV